MPQKNSLVKLIKIPKVLDDCILCFAQNPHHIPFKIKRIYTISKAANDLPRGFHAHKKTKQILFCLNGSIKIILDNGKERKEVFLNSPEVGVFIDKMIWHEMLGFKKNTILLVIASTIFDESDYIRNYEHFKTKIC